MEENEQTSTGVPEENEEDLEDELDDEEDTGT